MKSLSLCFAFCIIGITTLAQQDSAQNIQVILPLKVTSFYAQTLNKNIQLSWTVSSNEDARSFEVERADNNQDYKKVGGKLSSGKTGLSTYEFVDALPKVNTVFNYRVKVIAKDGSALYSSLQPAIVDEGRLVCKLKQNPVGHSIDVEVYTTEANDLMAFVFTGNGQKIISERTRLSPGTNQLSISSQKLLPGLHRLVIQMGNERKVFSFVKE